MFSRENGQRFVASGGRGKDLAFPDEMDHRSSHTMAHQENLPGKTEITRGYLFNNWN
jgi:hypothetical protein